MSGPRPICPRWNCASATHAPAWRMWSCWPGCSGALVIRETRSSDRRQPAGVRPARAAPGRDMAGRPIWPAGQSCRSGDRYPGAPPAGSSGSCWQTCAPALESTGDWELVTETGQGRPWPGAAQRHDSAPARRSRRPPQRRRHTSRRKPAPPPTWLRDTQPAHATVSTTRLDLPATREKTRDRRQLPHPAHPRRQGADGLRPRPQPLRLSGAAHQHVQRRN